MYLNYKIKFSLLKFSTKIFNPKYSQHSYLNWVPHKRIMYTIQTCSYMLNAYLLLKEIIQLTEFHVWEYLAPYKNNKSMFTHLFNLKKNLK